MKLIILQHFRSSDKTKRQKKKKRNKKKNKTKIKKDKIQKKTKEKLKTKTKTKIKEKRPPKTKNRYIMVDVISTLQKKFPNVIIEIVIFQSGNEKVKKILGWIISFAIF